MWVSQYPLFYLLLASTRGYMNCCLATAGPPKLGQRIRTADVGRSF
jgi:hypothetical protein